MPYITQERREELIGAIDDLHLLIESPGEMNFAITRLLLYENPQNYSGYCMLLGLLESVKLEFYRRAVAVYEDTKIQENGDVYV